MMSAAILRNVSKSYGDMPVLCSVNLHVPVGDIVGLCGGSGSGKSTLLRLIAGIERPDRGEVLHKGKALWSGTVGNGLANPGFAMPIFQNPATSLDPGWPIWRSVTEPLWRERLAKRQRQQIAGVWLAKADLSMVDPGARPGELSGGQCQRVAVLRAMIARPSLIIADEPTSALDPATAIIVRRLLKEAACAGTAIVLASHNMRELGSVCSRVLRLAKGSLVDVRPGDIKSGRAGLVQLIEKLKTEKTKSEVTHVPAIHTS